MTNNVYLKNNFIFQIPWDMNNSTTYTYGAKIDSCIDTFSYSNPMVAQAVIIHTWYSETSYPNQRFSPTLPLLKAGHDYVLNSVYQSYPDKSIFTQIDFFDNYGQKIDTIITDTTYADFHFPSEATSYQINLVNASNQKIIFDSMLIFESTSELTSYYFDVDKQLVLSSENSSQVVYISFNNYLNRLILMPVDAIHSKTKVIGDPYLNFIRLDDILKNNKKQFLDKIIHCIEPVNEHMTFRGYHLFDSILAVLIGYSFPCSEINVCCNFEEALRLEKQLSSGSIEILLNMISELRANQRMSEITNNI
ncbi:accessory Sec system protein Asp3 [Leuconostoc gelidum subsp. aenigmaticum]|uniref:accessory Sec system protein Asp3 n=1 Tax=Leuconostoc gelidum TaxID=1244 RepID=UPI001CC43000|nr:accessory Sec system protein Asp3 [Leuconostoc gelidum]MBZ6003531.1 accessory Sec system protein Asp3 [Leuconostoc gelidum subsp. aenigmaticum]